MGDYMGDYMEDYMEHYTNIINVVIAMMRHVFVNHGFSSLLEDSLREFSMIFARSSISMSLRTRAGSGLLR